MQTRTQKTVNKCAAEHILIALFHKIGPDVQVEESSQLDRMFDEVAKNWAGSLDQFCYYHQYSYSPGLQDALRTLLLGGSISRLSNGRFVASTHTSGPFGAKAFTSLPIGVQQYVLRLAERLRQCS